MLQFLGCRPRYIIYLKPACKRFRNHFYINIYIYNIYIYIYFRKTAKCMYLEYSILQFSLRRDMQKRYFRKFATWLSQNCDMMLLFYKSEICKSDIFSQICDMVFAKLRHHAALLQKRDMQKRYFRKFATWSSQNCDMMLSCRSAMLPKRHFPGFVLFV